MKRTEQRRRSRALVRALISKPYDRERFGAATECSICLGDYEPDVKVTPLPCQGKHIFHTNCITHWLLEKDVCPLCNLPISA